MKVRFEEIVEIENAGNVEDIVKIVIISNSQILDMYGYTCFLDIGTMTIESAPHPLCKQTSDQIYFDGVPPNTPPYQWDALKILHA